MPRYDPNAYWQELLEGEFSEAGVGYPELARSVNRAMYRTAFHAVTSALKAARIASPPRRVLDIGSGTGLWIDYWQRRGASEITGVDLTAASVERLRRRWPAHDFLQADVGEVGAKFPQDRDVVSAMSVLLHIVDDDRFRQAFSNLAAALRPGGALVLVEPAVVHRWWGPPFGEEASSKARPLADYRTALEGAGLELQVVRPATVLLANVIDTRWAATFHILNIYWSRLVRTVGTNERLGAAAGAVLGGADLLAIHAMRTGPSAKVLVARRRD